MPRSNASAATAEALEPHSNASAVTAEALERGTFPLASTRDCTSGSVRTTHCTHGVVHERLPMALNTANFPIQIIRERTMHVIHSPNHVFIMLQMGTSRGDLRQGEIEGQSIIRGTRPAASPRTARERG